MSSLIKLHIQVKNKENNIAGKAKWKTKVTIYFPANT